MNFNDDPSSWRQVHFGEVVRQVKTTVDPESSGLERLVAGEHMKPGELALTDWGTIGAGYLGPAFHRSFKAGQVLYGSRRTYLRKVAVADFDGVCANTTYVAESKDPERLLPDLLPFIMASDSFLTHSVAQSRGSVNPYVNWSDLEAFELKLPPMREQRRIAELLLAVQECIAALSRVEKCTKVAEVRFLSDLYRDSWESRTVAELGDVQLGQQLHPKYRSGANMHPYLRVANVGDDELLLSDVLEMDFSDARSERFRLEPGDVLLNEGQSLELVGRCAIYRGEIPDCHLQKTLILFRAGSDIEPEFALLWFRRCFYMGEFSAIAKRTTSIAHLTAVRFSAMTMPCPPIEEQQRLIRQGELLRQARRSSGEELQRLTEVRQSLTKAALDGG